MKNNLSHFLLIIISLISSISLSHGQVNYTVLVSGNCDMCLDRIEEAAYQVSGVLSAKYRLDQQKLEVLVDDDKFDIFELHNTVAESGHDTNQVSADDTVYDGLPACCQYREMPIEVNDAHHLEDHLVGYVYELKENGKREPLIGANLTWMGTSSGTVTDLHGAFRLDYTGDYQDLIISYVGFRNDTINVSKSGHVEIALDPSVLLETVEISYRRKSTEISYVSPIKLQEISSKELTKAACCSLSESFETTASVDVGFADAVTGLRTIQMLGLAGPYVQITREGLPDVRGISALYGMEYTPGPWIESIQLNQGTGSVVNGFEGIAGQINVELFKPYSDEQLYINGYANQGGRYEGNLNYNTEVSEDVATALLVHGSTRSETHDRNEDGFADMPVGDQVVLVNRWKFNFSDGWVGQVGVKLSDLRQNGGQLAGINDPWVSSVDINRKEAWAKTGILFDDNLSSLAIQLSYSDHTQLASFGSRRYDAEHKTSFANVLLQRMLQQDGDYLMVGASFLRDDVTESLTDVGSFKREENIPGLWMEYNYLQGEKWTIVPGIRMDHHSNFGWFFTSRLHIRYAPVETTVIRLAVGRGQKTASIFAENIGMLASNRSIIVNSMDSDDPYGLEPEIAWNYGINLVQNFTWFGKDASLLLDGYYTDFRQQVVVDYDQDSRSIEFYNLEGDSRSISLQAMLGFSPIEKIDVKLAYRYNDVKTDYRDLGLLQKPLVAAHRTFANIAYDSGNGWKLDYTINRIGSKRLAQTISSPDEFERPQSSPAYFISNAQISKNWKDRFELYLGVENLTNFRQEYAITSAEDPSNPYFDASQVWGPIFGRNIYIGLRHKLFNAN